MGKKKRRVEWGHYGPVSGPVTAACTSVAVAGWGSEFGLSPWYAVAVAGASALLVLAMDIRRGIPVFARLVHMGAWVFHGWWTWQGLTTTPWALDSIATLVAGSAVAVVATKAAAVHTENVREHEERVEEVQRRKGLAGEWESRISRVCRIKGVTVTGIDEWERPVPGEPGKTRKTGYSILVELPAGGWRWTDVSSKRLELVSDTNLPTGCGIEVRAGESAREVILDVTTVNVLGQDLPLGPIERRSIYDPIPVGIRHDGRFLELTLKWKWALLIGQTGSGKSNQLTAMLAYLLMCDDVLIFGIDFNGGKLFRPYLKPWLAGESKKPAIAAVATTEEEAIAMLKFLIAAIPARAQGYAELMDETDDDKVPSSSRVPHIVFVSDESNNLPASVKKLMVELSNRSRAVSIRGLTCALRAVDNGGTGLPVELNAQASAKVSMQVDGDQELAYLFNWGKAPRCEEIPGVGFGVGAEEGQIPSVFKGPRTKPSTAVEVARKSDEWRPDLDEVTIAAGPEYWATRWDKAKETWLAGKPQPEAAPSSQTPPAGPSRPRPTSGPVDPASGGDVALEAMRKAFRDSGLPVPGEDTPERPEGPQRAGSDREFEDIVAQGLADVGAPPRLLTVCVDAFGADTRALTATLAEAVGMSSRDLSGLLRMVGIEPLEHPFSRGGKAGKGYEKAAFEDTIRRIQAGEIVVPDAVRDAL